MGRVHFSRTFLEKGNKVIVQQQRNISDPFLQVDLPQWPFGPHSRRPSSESITTLAVQQGGQFGACFSSTMVRSQALILVPSLPILTAGSLKSLCESSMHSVLRTPRASCRSSGTWSSPRKHTLTGCAGTGCLALQIISRRTESPRGRWRMNSLGRPVSSID